MTQKVGLFINYCPFLRKKVRLSPVGCSSFYPMTVNTQVLNDDVGNLQLNGSLAQPTQAFKPSSKFWWYSDLARSLLLLSGQTNQYVCSVRWCSIREMSLLLHWFPYIFFPCCHEAGLQSQPKPPVPPGFAMWFTKRNHRP